MCSKEDFSDWSDINLEELLGDFTDDDVTVTESAGSSSDCDVYEDEIDNPVRNSKREKRSKDVEYVFDCPVCRKVLRSVGGFRGHVVKQHPSMDRSDFRGK